MKQKLLLVLILFASIVNAQEQRKMELNPPLNFQNCINCIDKNPALSFQSVKNLSIKCEDLFKQIGISIIPVKVLISVEGNIKAIEMSYEIHPIEQRLVNNSFLNKFFQELIGERFASFKNIQSSEVEGRIFLKLENNNLIILNQ